VAEAEFELFWVVDSSSVGWFHNILSCISASLLTLSQYYVRENQFFYAASPAEFESFTIISISIVDLDPSK
jgi:hypothetical protein